MDDRSDQRQLDSSPTPESNDQGSATPTSHSSGAEVVRPATPEAEGDKERWDDSRLPTVDPSSYEILGEFARGGLGRILRAKDTRLGRQVALKELLKSRGKSRERFLREALVTSRLEHPAIVPVHEAGRWPTGEPFFAMKLVQGKSLDEVIQKAKSYAERVALLPRVIDVAEAMAYAHHQRIIHRDLKPQNILVGAFGETVVIDWGLAKDLKEGGGSREEGGSEGRPPERDEAEGSRGSGEAQPPPSALPPPASRLPPNLTQDGSILGTPAYMPPEQAYGEEVDERADVYAIGAILYHLLTGEAPYTGKTSEEILNNVVSGPPTPLEVRQPKVPHDLATIVKKAMAQDPKARYPTAKGLADDLKRFQTGKLVDAHKYSTAELLRRWVYRYRAPIAVALILLAVLIVGAILSVERIIQERNIAEIERAYAEIERAAAERQKEIVEEEKEKTEARGNALALLEAKTSLRSDPTMALAWLKSMSPSGPGWDEAKKIAEEARRRGVARHILRGHEGDITDLAFSPDGKTLATSSRDQTIRLWDMTKGGAKLLRAHDGDVTALAFSAQGDLLVSVSQDNTARLTPLKGGRAQSLSGYMGASSPTSLSVEAKEKALLSPDSLGASLSEETPTTLSTKSARDALLSEGEEEAGLLGFEHVALTRDGAYIAASSSDHTIHLFSRETGAHEIFSGHKGEVNHLVFSPDGRFLASAGNDNTIRLLDRETKVQRVLYGHEGSVFHLAFSPDGETLASASEDKTIRLWGLGFLGPELSCFSSTAFALATGNCPPPTILTGHTGIVTYVEFSPDGEFLASASHDKTVRLWAVPDLRKGGATPGRIFSGHKGAVTYVGFSPKEGLLASSSDDKTLRLWDLETGNSRVLLGHEERVTKAAFSPDGKLLASISLDGTARVWDIEGAPRIHSGHEDWVTAIGFSPDGTILASASRDSTIRLWDLETGNSRVFSGHSGEVTHVEFSPDGRTLVSAGRDNTVRLWDVETSSSRTLFGHEGAVTYVTFSPDGKILASASEDKTIKLWDLETGKARVLVGHKDVVRHFAFLDSTLLASASEDKTIRLWDLTTLKSRELVGHKGWVTHVKFSKDGALLASASSDDTIRLWDVATGESQALTGHGDTVTQVKFSKDGKTIASASRDKTVRLWDVETRSGRALLGHEDWVTQVKFSKDGKTIASASRDTTVRLWDIATGGAGGEGARSTPARSESAKNFPSGASGSSPQVIEGRVLRGHTAAITHMEFSPDGKILASASLDSTVRIWELGEGGVTEGRLLSSAGEEEGLPSAPGELGAWLEGATRAALSEEGVP